MGGGAGLAGAGCCSHPLPPPPPRHTEGPAHTSLPMRGCRHTHQLVQAPKAGHAEVIVVGVHLEAREGSKVVLPPLPGIAKHICEAAGAGRQRSDRALAAVCELEVEAKGLCEGRGGGRGEEEVRGGGAKATRDGSGSIWLLWRVDGGAPAGGMSLPPSHTACGRPCGATTFSSAQPPPPASPTTKPTPWAHLQHIGAGAVHGGVDIDLRVTGH